MTCPLDEPIDLSFRAWLRVAVPNDVILDMLDDSVPNFESLKQMTDYLRGRYGDGASSSASALWSRYRTWKFRQGGK